MSEHNTEQRAGASQQAQQAQQTGSPSTAPAAPTPRMAPTSEASGWIGWILFAATAMTLVGMLHVIQGLVAIFDDEYYLVTDNGLTVELDYTAWGWTHLIFGAIVVAAGLSLFAGRTWARVVGVAVAGLSILVNFVFIAAYPLWSVTIIAINVFVIMALTVHGREITTVQGRVRR